MTLLVEQLLMTAMLHNLAIVNDVDLVHIFYGGQPVGNGDSSAANLGSIQGILYYLKQRRLSVKEIFEYVYLYVYTFSLSVSRAEVASSRSRILGFLTRALAMATLCFCPPES